MKHEWKFLEDTLVPCECSRPGCVCDGEDTDVMVNGKGICGCCAGDCPDVHPDEAQREYDESVELQVLLKKAAESPTVRITRPHTYRLGD